MLNFAVSTSRRLRQRMLEETSASFADNLMLSYRFCTDLMLFSGSPNYAPDQFEILTLQSSTDIDALTSRDVELMIFGANNESNHLLFYVDVPEKIKGPDDVDCVLVTAQFSLVSRNGRKVVAKFHFRVQGGSVVMCHELIHKSGTVRTSSRKPRKSVRRSSIEVKNAKKNKRIVEPEQVGRVMCI